MIKVIFTMALIMGMSSSVFAGQKAKHQTSLDVAQDNLQHTLVCLPDSATATTDGVINEEMSRNLENDMYTSSSKRETLNEMPTKINLQNDFNADGVLDACQLECVTVVPFEFAGSSSSVTEVEFEFEGTLFAGSCIASFKNTSYDLTYASDMTFAIVNPDGKGVRFGGGSNSFVEQHATAGGFPSSWGSKQSGNYPRADISFRNTAITGSGTWKLLVSNGWLASTGGKWTGDIELCRLGTVITEPVTQDCNENGTEDADDISAGAEDCNGDGQLGQLGQLSINLYVEKLLVET